MLSYNWILTEERHRRSPEHVSGSSVECPAAPTHFGILRETSQESFSLGQVHLLQWSNQLPLQPDQATVLWVKWKILEHMEF